MAQVVTYLPGFEDFQALASVPVVGGGGARVNGAAGDGPGGWAIPIFRTLLADHLTPVTAYERLAGAGGGAGDADGNGAHSFLLESVVGGERIARYSFLGARPRRVIKAFGRRVVLEDFAVGGAMRGAEIYWRRKNGNRRIHCRNLKGC